MSAAVTQAGHEETGRERLTGDSGVDPDGCVRVADSLGVQIGHRNLKIIGQLVGIILKAPDPAPGVMQDYQGASGGLPLAQATKQGPRAQRCRGDATANVAHHHSLPECQAKHVARVHPGIDAADSLQRLVRG